jgi:hypothetical protein
MANKKFTIQGNTKIPNFASALEIDVDEKYEAYSKPIPEPTPYQDGVIIWFSAFGVRDRTLRKDADVTYEVTLQALPKGKRLFVLYGGEPHEITARDAGKGKIKFTLSVGDPPTGAYP